MRTEERIPGDANSLCATRARRGIAAAIAVFAASAGAASAAGPARWLDSSRVEQLAILALVQTIFAAAIAITVLGRELSLRRHENTAWPDRLHQLIEPHRPAGALNSVIAIAAGIVLLLGVGQLSVGGPATRGLAALPIASAIAVAVACFYLAHRRWNANLFGLGAAHVTLGVATIAILPLPTPGTSGLVSRLPLTLNAILIALAAMTFIWCWLARFWDQQLLDGRAWTTAGRAIPYVRRIGFLVAALAVLVAFEMAFWPRWRYVLERDDSAARWLSGLAAILLLALVTAGEARRNDSPTLAGMTILSLAAAVLFAGFRWQNLEWRGWITQYSAAIAAVAALPILALAEALPASRWRCFAPGLWFAALLVLPAFALTQLLASARPPAEWVRPMTLATTGVLYALAAAREGRRAFLILAAILLLAAVVFLLRILGVHTI
ncbi:MAG: hypothetical protein L6Q92_02165 [Phycisphaerae bacterium]|nr:hypothetical protein [Phycisphaerae bacterium]